MTIRHGETGQFLRQDCPDLNCDGELAASANRGDPVWACNGLTHLTETGPLIPCDREYPRRDEGTKHD